MLDRVNMMVGNTNIRILSGVCITALITSQLAH
jgi:hypothetical protein